MIKERYLTTGWCLGFTRLIKCHFYKSATLENGDLRNELGVFRPCTFGRRVWIRKPENPNGPYSSAPSPLPILLQIPRLATMAVLPVSNN
jgi:hypothetical protein